MSNEKKNRVQEMVEVLQEWQVIERKSMSDTAEIMERTQSPLIRIVMEIIRHDSLMHHRVQQFLVDSLTVKDVTVTREDVADVWEAIEAHDETERKTIEMATTLKERAWNPVHKQLLDYLVTDETKHDGLLQHLGEIKAGMAKASGG
jgi:rubrerythrin